MVLDVVFVLALLDAEEEEEERQSSSLSAASLALARILESSPLASRRDRRERSRSARDIEGGRKGRTRGGEDETAECEREEGRGREVFFF